MNIFTRSTNCRPISFYMSFVNSIVTMYKVSHIYHGHSPFFVHGCLIYSVFFVNCDSPIFCWSYACIMYWWEDICHVFWMQMMQRIICNLQNIFRSLLHIPFLLLYIQICTKNKTNKTNRPRLFSIKKETNIQCESNTLGTFSVYCGLGLFFYHSRPFLVPDTLFANNLFFFSFADEDFGLTS